MSDSPRVLLIDDEPDILQLLAITLGRMRILSDTAQSVFEAKQALQDTPYQFCITDMKLPDGSGMDILDYIHEVQPECPAAVLTAHGNMEMAVEALKKGAFDFVSKPIDINKLRELVQAALKLSGQTAPRPSHQDKKLLGVSPSMIELRSQIAKVARSQAPVAIYGESGTGKELVARLIHDASPRGDGPFVPVNCGAIPAELMESELFGYVKGAFTGAHQDKQGLFQLADGGTLFLDEVADLPLNMQVKLLRAIQEKAVRPVGAAQEVPCNVRILTATHKNLVDLVQERKFRQDLYYRLNVIEIRVPPLRERRQDIPDLARHFLKRLSPDRSFSDSALHRLRQYDYPGNVRELENVVERAVALSDNPVIEDDDLDFLSPTANLETKEQDVLRPANLSLDEYLETIEREEITRALDKCQGNKTAAAAYLGISFRALRYKIKKLGLED
jgi:two-component system response regulator PilR (NtrC family)